MQGDLFPEDLKSIYRNESCFDLSDVPIGEFEPTNIYSKWLSDRCNHLRSLPKDKYFIFRSESLPFVINKGTGRKLTPSFNRDRYPCVSINSRIIHIHSLVGIFFIENIKPTITNVIDHLDQDRYNYRIENLQWVSHSDNVRRKTNET